jgi:tRNA1Val (adenine37-N6)-methyltransferase
MANPWFQFKKFMIRHDRSAMKVTTDSCLFGAWTAMQLKQSTNPGKKLLDIGTGTGLLSVMVAQENPEINIDALEIEPDAAAQAVENVNATSWKERINVITGDVRTIDLPGNYDYIISNPPFYQNELTSLNQLRNRAHHGTDLSLDELFSFIREHLDDNGKFFLLLPYKRSRLLQELPGKYDLSVNHMVLIKQSVQHGYFRIMLSGYIGKQPGHEIRIDELTITAEQGEYTQEFRDLLKTYYLHL